MPPPIGWGSGAPMVSAPPPPRRRGLGHTVLVIIVVFIAILLVFGVVAYLLVPAPSSAIVEVTGINFQSPDNACGLNGAVDTSDYNTTAGVSFTLSYTLSGPNATSGGGTTACTISTVSTTTSGFSISGANVPLSIPANSSQVFSFTVNPPGTAWTGTLTIVLT
jgi:hypothetical protein